MRKQTKRKVWRLVNPIEHAIQGIKPPGGEKLDKLRTFELTSIEAFRMGQATKQDWGRMVGILNLTEHLANRGIGPEALPTVRAAHDHLIEAAKRYEKTQKMGLTGAGLQCMRDLYEWHDLIRQSITLSEYERALVEVHQRIQSKAPEVCCALED